MFSAFNYLIPSCILRFSIYVIFLCRVLGWQSLVVGLSLNLLFVPLKSHFIKKYTAAQKSLKKSRERKMSVIAEALQSLRQIKFLAHEDLWEEKISAVRDKELDSLWKLFVAISLQMFCSVAGPVLLAAGSFSTYAIINGELRSGVAFTALSLFSQLEGTISMLPDLVSDLVGTKVSMKRIEGFLNAPEMSDVVQASTGVSFRNATFSWPADHQIEGSDHVFFLRNITVTFPIGKLSVVTGDTGSGKTLLLSAIVGEVDVEVGSIHAPVSTSSTAFSVALPKLIEEDDWILPSAIAYVAQTPWIENATIKLNIIFNLPFNLRRYNAVLSACSLFKDLEALLDGDETEIGAQGTSLSGGQKWRITFVRALYSRAGTLVLDDIFSAVDVHVGKHMFKEGLCGNLARGRTRILVTHQVSSFLPGIDYLVHLKNQTIQSAEVAFDTQRTEDSSAINEEDALVSNNSSVSFPIFGSEPQTKHTPEEKANGKEGLTATPRKLIQDENRQTGHTSHKMYSEYLKSIGGPQFWTFCMLSFGG